MIKQHQIENYFMERRADISVLFANDAVVRALEAFSSAFVEEGHRTGGEGWAAAEAEFGPWLAQYKKEYGYYDLFLINKNGDKSFLALSRSVYSMEKEGDLGRNAAASRPDSGTFCRHHAT